MRMISEMIDVLEKWVAEDSVGNLVLYHPPKVSKFGAYIEQTIKARELNDETIAALNTLVKNLGADRGEFFCDKDGNPDRVKIVRTV